MSSVTAPREFPLAAIEYLIPLFGTEEEEQTFPAPQASKPRELTTLTARIGSWLGAHSGGGRVEGALYVVASFFGRKHADVLAARRHLKLAQDTESSSTSEKLFAKAERKLWRAIKRGVEGTPDELILLYQSSTLDPVIVDGLTWGITHSAPNDLVQNAESMLDPDIDKTGVRLDLALAFLDQASSENVPGALDYHVKLATEKSPEAAAYLAELGADFRLAAQAWSQHFTESARRFERQLKDLSAEQTSLSPDNNRLPREVQLALAKVHECYKRAIADEAPNAAVYFARFLTDTGQFEQATKLWKSIGDTVNPETGKPTSPQALICAFIAARCAEFWQGADSTPPSALQMAIAHCSRGDAANTARHLQDANWFSEAAEFYVGAARKSLEADAGTYLAKAAVCYDRAAEQTGDLASADDYREQADTCRRAARGFSPAETVQSTPEQSNDLGAQL